MKFLYAFFAAVLLAACGALNAMGDSPAPSGQSGFVQVVEGRFDAGTTTRDAFRLEGNGTLTRASWTDDNRLLGISEPVTIEADAAQAARSLLTGLGPTEPPALEPGIAPPPPVYTAEITTLGPDGGGYVFRNGATDALLGLLERWRAAAPLGAAGSDTVLWTMPAPDGAGNIDAQPGTPMGDAIEAALSGAVAVPLASGVAAPFRAEHGTGRTRFIGRARDTPVYFGTAGGA